MNQAVINSDFCPDGALVLNFGFYIGMHLLVLDSGLIFGRISWTWFLYWNVFPGLGFRFLYSNAFLGLGFRFLYLNVFLGQEFKFIYLNAFLDIESRFIYLNAF